METLPECIIDLINGASKIFHEKFQRNPTVCGFSPGRVNLIGEHVDYNDGFVFPMVMNIYGAQCIKFVVITNWSIKDLYLHKK